MHKLNDDAFTEARNTALNKLSKERIEIVVEPEFFLEGVKCPFCHKTTLGVVPSQFDDLFYMRCVNKACLLNYDTPVPLELMGMAKEALGIDQSE